MTFNEKYVFPQEGLKEIRSPEALSNGRYWTSVKE